MQSITDPVKKVINIYVNRYTRFDSLISCGRNFAKTWNKRC